jgi:REase_DpnII-MboI
MALAITDEYDVQDHLHALLRLHFDDVREEEWTPSYGGARARMDFLLKRERKVVETKMTWAGLEQRKAAAWGRRRLKLTRSPPIAKIPACLLVYM